MNKVPATAIPTLASLDLDESALMQIGHEWGQHMTQIWRFGGKIGDTTAAARVLNPALLNGRKPVDIPASLRQVPTIMSAREDTMGIGAVEFRSRSAAQSAERSGRATKTLLTSLAVGMALAAGSQAQASVRAAIVLDQNTGRIYKSFNANVLHKPASLTKMMSLYLVFDALKAGRLRLNQWVRVSYRAASRPPSKMYLRAGQRITIRKLIYGMAVKSANDAATAAAEAVAGSEAAFARMMTMKARELGMYRTVFRTASGLPARGQITTAKDMAILARALRRDHPRYYKVFSARYFRHAGRSYANTNRLLHRYGVIDGLKTGYTRRARYNLATSATNGRKRVVVVVLGATSSWERYRVTRNLLAYAWRARPYGSYVVARAARNHFRNRSRRTRMIAMARAARRKPINRTARKSATARNTANNIGANVAIHKKTLATRRAERRRNRIQLGTGRAYSAVTRRPVITYRRENVLHLGNYKRLRTASRKAIRAYRRLPVQLPAWREGQNCRGADPAWPPLPGADRPRARPPYAHGLSLSQPPRHPLPDHHLQGADPVFRRARRLAGPPDTGKADSRRRPQSVIR